MSRSLPRTGGLAREDGRSICDRGRVTGNSEVSRHRNPASRRERQLSCWVADRFFEVASVFRGTLRCSRQKTEITDTCCGGYCSLRKVHEERHPLLIPDHPEGVALAREILG
jgi:hypothetical protein